MSKITKDIAGTVVSGAVNAKFAEHIAATAYSLFKSIRDNEAAVLCAESSRMFTQKQINTGLVRTLQEITLQIKLPGVIRYGQRLAASNEDGGPSVYAYPDRIVVNGAYGIPKPLKKSDAAIVPQGATKALIISLWDTVQKRDKFRSTLENIVVVGHSIPALISEYPELAQFLPGKPVPPSDNTQIKAMLKGLKKVTK